MKTKTVIGFPNYEINELGQIKHNRSKKILSQSLSTKGYYQVNISNKCRRVHRLLAETFIPNPDKCETVNHKDGDKVNNSLDNLEWMTRADNVKHSREVLGIIPIPYSKNKVVHHLKGKSGSKSNRGKPISSDYKGHWIFGSAYEAAKEIFGDSSLGKQIRQAIKRNRPYKGIIFQNYATNKT